MELTETRPDLLTEVGLVNFNAEDTETVCKYMIEQTGKVGIVANQVQVSNGSRVSGDFYATTEHI